MQIPGFVDAHCHAFQRALRGRDRGGDFWAWRDGMIALAESLTVDGRSAGSTSRCTASSVRTASPRSASSTTSGSTEARAAAEAAAEAGIAFVLLYACYLRGGVARFRQESVAEYLREVEALRADGIRVGIAPHSVRACPADALRELGAYAAAHDLPLHVHADEQPREIDECVAETGMRPIELLDATGLPRPADDGRPRDARRRARARSARRRRARGSACARRPRRTSATASCRSRASCIAGSGCASAATRTSASTRSRSCASSRGSPAARRGSAASSRSTRCSRPARPTARPRSASTTWPDATVDLAHPQLRGVDEDGGLRRLGLRLRRRACCGRRPTSSASASRYALSAAAPWRPQAPSYER